MDKKLKIALIGYSAISAGLLLINILASPMVSWAFIPMLLLLWWPLGVYYAVKKNMKLFSVAGTLLNVVFFASLNLAYSPQYPWVLFIAGPMLWWPIAIFAGKKATSQLFAWCSYFAIVAYYTLINIFIEPRHLFTVFIAYGLIWWPIGLHYRGNMSRKVLAILGAVTHIAFAALMNQILKPEYFWSIFVFAPLLWWPICEFAGQKAKTVSFAWLSYFALIGYYGCVNFFIETRHPFIVYLIFAFAWWPLGLAYSKHRKSWRFSLEGALLLTIFFAAVNWITTPTVLWAVYPVAAVWVWPIVICTLKILLKRRQSV